MGPLARSKLINKVDKLPLLRLAVAEAIRVFRRSFTSCVNEIGSSDGGGLIRFQLVEKFVEELSSDKDDDLYPA